MALNENKTLDCFNKNNPIDFQPFLDFSKSDPPFPAPQSFGTDRIRHSPEGGSQGGGCQVTHRPGALDVASCDSYTVWGTGLCTWLGFS